MKALFIEATYGLLMGAIVLMLTQDRNLAILAAVIVAALYRYD